MKMLYAREQGIVPDHAAFEAQVRTATTEIVRQQINCEIDVVNDGEMSKIGYSTYVQYRLTGFEGKGSFPR